MQSSAVYRNIAKMQSTTSPTKPTAPTIAKKYKQEEDIRSFRKSTKSSSAPRNIQKKENDSFKKYISKLSQDLINPDAWNISEI